MEKVTRKEKLLELVKDDIILVPLMEKVLYLEEKMEKLENLPFIKVNPKNEFQQRVTPVGKLYKDLFQQYINALKVLEKALKNDDAEEISPLREWFNQRLESEKR